MRQGSLFPPEVTGNIPRITLLGTEEVRIEQHQGVVIYHEDCIVFRTAGGQATITGRALRFLHYSAQEARIGGGIDGVRLEGPGRNK